MVYPRQCWMLYGSWLKNRPSWNEPRVRLKLGAKLNLGSGNARACWSGYHSGARTLLSLSLWALCRKERSNSGPDEWEVRYSQLESLLTSSTGNTSRTDWREAHNLWRLAGRMGDNVVGPGVIGLEHVGEDDILGSDTSEEEGALEEPYVAPETGSGSTKAQASSLEETRSSKALRQRTRPCRACEGSCSGCRDGGSRNRGSAFAGPIPFGR